SQGRVDLCQPSYWCRQTSCKQRPREGLGAGPGAHVPRSLRPAPAGGLFEVAVLTGLRRGEITGLRWVDVDLTKRRITVRRNRVSVRGRVIEQQTAKTKA